MAWALWITGLPATGKSWLTKELTKHLKFEWLRLDLFRKEIIPDPTYSKKEREYVYTKLAERAATLTKKNKNVIIDATDNLPSRGDIDTYAKGKNLPWIYGSVEAFNGQVCFFKDSSFNDVFKTTQKTPAGIAAPIVMHIASLQANLALRYLAGLNVKKDYLYYLFFNDEGELITQKFGLPKS